MEIFHGECHGCTMQDKKGLGYCVGCQFFDTNWDLPNLNDEHARNEKTMNVIRDRARATEKKSRL